MKIFKRSIAGPSLALLLLQLALVSSVAARYAYQRWRCPRVWTQAVTRAYGFEPQFTLRGRYLALQLRVDGCASTLPSAAQAQFPRDLNGAAVPGRYSIRGGPVVRFRAALKVQDNRLQAIRIADAQQTDDGQLVSARTGEPCDAMTLDDPVLYYVPEGSPAVFPLKPGQELWVEATIPPQGPPRPTQLAIKQNGAWRPLAF